MHENLISIDPTNLQVSIFCQCNLFSSQIWSRFDKISTRSSKILSRSQQIWQDLTRFGMILAKSNEILAKCCKIGYPLQKPTSINIQPTPKDTWLAWTDASSRLIVGVVLGDTKWSGWVQVGTKPTRINLWIALRLLHNRLLGPSQHTSKITGLDLLTCNFHLIFTNKGTISD